MASASHNPPEDNGIKLFGFRGFKLSDRLEDAIEAELGGESEARPSGNELAIPSEASSYLDHVVSAAEADESGPISASSDIGSPGSAAVIAAVNFSRKSS